MYNLLIFHELNSKFNKLNIEFLANQTTIYRKKFALSENLITFINLGYEVVKQNNSVYSNLYQKHFSSFLRFCCFEKKDGKLYAPPIVEMVQSLFEMLNITINCYAKYKFKPNIVKSNYIDFIQAFNKLISNEVIHNADLGEVSSRLCKAMLAEKE